MKRAPRFAAVLLLAVTACSGPRARVNIGGKTLPIDVAFGRPAAGVVPGVERTPTVLVPVPGGVGLVPVPALRDGFYVPGGKPGVARPTPAPAPCPEVPAGRFPADAVGAEVRGLPAAASYPVRYTAHVVEDGKTTDVAGIGRHTVQAAQRVPGGSTFEVRVEVAGADVTYAYAVQDPPNNQLPAGAPATGRITLRTARGDGGLGYQASFRPTTPLDVFPLPAFTGQQWTSNGADATSGTVASISGRVLAANAVVNACGTPVAAWRTEATLSVTSPNQELHVTLVGYYATQYGGLPIAETQAYEGTAGGVPVSCTVEWTFAVPPRAAP